MEKTIVGAGASLVALGLGFGIAGYIDPGLHFAFKLGGIAWTAIGGITIMLGLRMRKEKERSLEVLR